jgi:hypothetical protein
MSKKCLIGVIVSTRSAIWQIAANLDFEKPDELRIHVFVIVRDVQADHACIGEIGFELGVELVSMSALHDEDDVGPTYEFRRYRILRIVIEACRTALDVLAQGEHLLRSRTA